MRAHAAEPREPGSVALGIHRMLPGELRDDPFVTDAIASLVGVLFKIAGLGAS